MPIVDVMAVLVGGRCVFVRGRGEARGWWET